MNRLIIGEKFLAKEAGNQIYCSVCVCARRGVVKITCCKQGTMTILIEWARLLDRWSKHVDKDKNQSNRTEGRK